MVWREGSFVEPCCRWLILRPRNQLLLPRCRRRGIETRKPRALRAVGFEFEASRALQRECQTKTSRGLTARKVGGSAGQAREPVPLLQLLARGDPPRRDDVHEVPPVPPQRGGPAGRG